MRKSDSSVARAIASRLGVGRVRHLQTSCLWVQQWVAQHLLKVLPVPTEFNPADLGTKCFAGKRLRLLCYLVGLVRDNGDHVGHHEFREAVARRAGNVDRNKDVVVRLVQLLAAANLLGCEFGPGGPDDLFEDLAALIYMTILFVVRYLWLLAAMALVWFMAQRVRSSNQKAQEPRPGARPGGGTAFGSHVLDRHPWDYIAAGGYYLCPWEPQARAGQFVRNGLRTSRMTVRRAIGTGRAACKHCFQDHWEYSRGQRDLVRICRSTGRV
eukprot:s1232_g13.t2